MQYKSVCIRFHVLEYYYVWSQKNGVRDKSNILHKTTPANKQPKTDINHFVKTHKKIPAHLSVLVQFTNKDMFLLLQTSDQSRY